MSDHIKPVPSVPAPSFRLVVDNTGQFCMHESVNVCERQRSVTCNNCNAPMDAFDVLLRRAKEIERWDWNLRLTKDEVRKAELRLEELKMLERNAVSRLNDRDTRATFARAKEERAKREQEKLKEVK